MRRISSLYVQEENVRGPVDYGRTYFTVTEMMCGLAPSYQ